MQTKVYTFYDFYNNKVELAFKENYFSGTPKHVWIICRYKDEWLLTIHAERGIEFPGGKVEENEAPHEAAIREVFEETGGIVSKLTNIGQYKVTAKQDIVIKNIYYAEISKLEKQQHYFETKGPLLLKNLPEEMIADQKYSFIMKDKVLPYSLKFIKNNF